MAEENIKFIDVIRAKIGLAKKPEPEQRTTQYVPADGKKMKGAFGLLRKWYYGAIKSAATRKEKYEKYKFLDNNLAEAEASLNIYSDNIVSGAIGGEENYKIAIDQNTPGIDKIEEVVKTMEKKTGIKDQIWEIAREMNGYGDDFYEQVITEENNEYWITKLKQLPRETIFANVDELGVFVEKEFPYIQAEELGQKDPIKFDPWRLVHFKLGHKLYGVDRALFAGAPQRIGRQLLWIDDSVVIARLTRAYMRYGFNVDTSGMSDEQAWEFIDEFRERTKRTEIVNQTTGRIDIADNPPMPDEDVFLPVGEGSKQSIQVLSGDPNVGRIEDIKYLQNKFFMSVGMPKAYASIEGDVRGKATLGQIDIQFARQVRRKQNALKPGLTHTYRTQFLIAGIDPDAFVWSVVFPEMATMDEMLKWEMEELKAKIAKLFVVDIGVLNNAWVLEKLLGFSQEDIEKYATFLPVTPGEEGLNLAPELAAMVKRDPYTRQILDDLKDTIAWKIKREKEIEGKKFIGLDRSKPVGEPE